MYVRRQNHIWREQILLDFPGMSLMDGHLFSEVKYRPEAPFEILVIHASAYCSMRKKQPLIVFDLFFFFIFFDWNSNQ